MRIPPWTPEAKAQPYELVDAILKRRRGELLNLDRALLWSEPLARGWNVYLKAVRTELAASRKLRELAICTVALITGAHYEYHHHAPDYLAEGGTQASLDALAALVKSEDLTQSGGLSGDELLMYRYAAQMTRDVRVSDEIANKMRERFSIEEVVEFTAAIATYNMVARFLVALEITPEH